MFLVSGAIRSARPRLLAQLESGLDRKLTLVSAAAGMGKSTLLAQWLGNNDHASAWLALDEYDNDPTTFLHYVVAAIQTLFPDACAETSDLWGAQTLAPANYLATVLINEIGDLPDDFILVFDDYHTIDDEVVHQVLAKLIKHMPPNLHLVLTSRTDPPLPLAQLRSMSETTEVRSHDLRFTREEASDFLQSVAGGPVSQDVVNILAERTEGWIVGLRLAALSIGSWEDSTDFIRSFQQESSGHVIEYLADEVLDHQPQPIQDFLLKTSILERFSAPLCSELIDDDPGTGAAQAILEHLNKENLFLVPLDHMHTWYRYHHLFRELLESRLQAKYTPASIAALHRSAAGWLAEQGYIDEAIQHNLAAGDAEAAVALVEDQSQNLLNGVDRHILEKWLSMLPEDAVWYRPKLLLGQAWILFRQWRITALDSVLETIQDSLTNDIGSLTGDERHIISGQALALRCVTAYLLRHDYEHALDLSKAALQQLPAVVHDARGVAAAFLAFSQVRLGQMDTAVSLLQTIIDDPTPLGPAKTQVYIGLSLIFHQAGELHRLSQHCDYFSSFAAGSSETNAIPGLNYVAGFPHYQHNDLTAASRYFSTMVELRYLSNFVAALNTGIGLARIFQVQGKLGKAQELIHLLYEDTYRLQNTDLLPLLESAQAELQLAEGKTAPALRWAQEFQPESVQDNLFYLEVPFLTQARILVAHGSVAAVRATSRHLEQRLAEMQRHHFTIRVIQISSHLALVYDRLKRSDDALASLRRALTLGRPGGFVRPFVECGPALVPFLEQLRLEDTFPEYVSQVLAGFGAEVQPTARVAPWTGPVEPLTRREMEVLRLLQAQMTNQEIADELVISLPTVKRHASNIYGKLAVNRRGHAVRKATQLGLLPPN